MTNKLELDFTGIGIADESIGFFITENGSNFQIIETFKAVRDASGEVEIGSGATEQAENFYTAISQDYASRIYAEIDGTTVTLYSRQGYPIFGVSVNNDYVSDTIVSVPVLVTGLNKDRYLINNDIIMEIAVGAPLDFYRVVVVNMTNGQASGDIILYPNLVGVSILNLSPYVKGLFSPSSDYPYYDLPNMPTTNAALIQVSVYLPSDSDTPSFQQSRTFIFGGNRTNDTNQVLASNEILRPSVKLPVWPGYPTAEYYLDGGVIKKRLLSEVSESDIERRRAKGCNMVYMKFLNQKGGYSNWMFESHTDSESNQNQGTYIRENKIQDLGNTADNSAKLFSKVPDDYIGLIRDLIISPEIYRYDDNGDFVRVTSGRNTIVYDNVKTGYYVTINIENHFRFNPTPQWSN